MDPESLKSLKLIPIDRPQPESRTLSMLNAHANLTRRVNQLADGASARPAPRRLLRTVNLSGPASL